MKVFISVDMEGISGLVRWMDVASQGIDFHINRRLMTADTNAAIAGAFDAGATEVIVEENHGVEDLCVLLMEEVDPRCEVIRGAGRPGATTMSGLTSDVGVVLLVGHHARAGSFPGIMAHTISGTWFARVLLDQKPIGEPDFFSLRAGELGIPVGMVSGDQIVAEQVLAFAPNAETAIVKHALAHQSARCIPPERARPIIQASAYAAVEKARAGSLSLRPDQDRPYSFELELKKPLTDHMSANLEQLKEFEIIDDRRVKTHADDMDLGFRRCAYLGFADLPGITRY